MGKLKVLRLSRRYLRKHFSRVVRTRMRTQVCDAQYCQTSPERGPLNRPGAVFDEIQSAFLMYLELIVQQVFKSALSSGTFIIPVVEDL